MNTRNYNTPGHVCPITGRRAFTVDEAYRRRDLKRRKWFQLDFFDHSWSEILDVHLVATHRELDTYKIRTVERDTFLASGNITIYVEQDFSNPARCHIHPSGRGGFAVRRNGVNPIPSGFDNFRTIRNAVLAVKVLERIESKPKSFPFWDIYNRASGLWEINRQTRQKYARSVNMVIVRLDRHNHAMRPGPSPGDLFEAFMRGWPPRP